MEPSGSALKHVLNYIFFTMAKRNANYLGHSSFPGWLADHLNNNL